MGSAPDAGSLSDLVMNITPDSGTTTFNGSAPAYSTVVAFSGGVSGGGIRCCFNAVPAASALTTNYYLMNPYVPLGIVSGAGTPYGVVTNLVPLPTTLTVGESGILADLTYYHDSTRTVTDADETVAHSVMVNDSTTLLFCLSATFSNVTAQGLTDGMANGAESDCYAVGSAGNVTLASVTFGAVRFE